MVTVGNRLLLKILKATHVGWSLGGFAASNLKRYLLARKPAYSELREKLRSEPEALLG